jgi:hypothetical protein
MELLIAFTYTRHARRFNISINLISCHYNIAVTKRGRTMRIETEVNIVSVTHMCILETDRILKCLEKENIFNFNF